MNGGIYTTIKDKMVTHEAAEILEMFERLPPESRKEIYEMVKRIYDEKVK